MTPPTSELFLWSRNELIRTLGRWDVGRFAVGCWTLDVGRWTVGRWDRPDVGRCWTLDSGRGTLDFGRWMLDRWTLDSRRGTLNFGRWMLDRWTLGG